MIQSEKVAGRSGTPDVWITENLHGEPEDSAAYSIRVSWEVNRMNCGLVNVEAVHYKKLFDGCGNARSTNVEENVPKDHLEAMRTELQLELLDKSRDQTIRFTQFDVEHVVENSDSETEKGIF